MKLNPQSKRKVLGSLLVIGMIAAAAGTGTLAYFSDTETSADNVFTAGAVDLKMDWNESYNGEHIEEQLLTDNPGPIFSFDDLKPGDYGEATISVHPYGNPSYIWLKANLTEDDEFASTEPELLVDEPDDPNDPFDGELAENIRVKLWYDDGDNIHQEDEEIIYGGADSCSVVNKDIVLALDNSGSMEYDQYGGDPNGDGVTKFDDMKNATNVFLDDAFQNGAQGALIGMDRFGGTDDPFSRMINLSDNETALRNAINDLEPVGEDETGTDLAGGVEEGHAILMDGRAAADDVLIVLADGAQSNIPGDPVAEAQVAKDAGVRVITITLDSGTLPDTMEEMASSPDDAYLVTDSSTLPSVFQTIFEEVCTDEDRLSAMALDDGVLLDANLSTEETDPYVNSTTRYLGFSWELPLDVGNEIQRDRVKFDLSMYAEQARHNDNPQNPWT